MVLIDLSEAIYNNMPKPPSLPEVEIWTMKNHEVAEEQQKGYSTKLLGLNITEHISTHIDAPSHFTASGKHIDELPLEHFYMIDTVVINLPQKEEWGVIHKEEIVNAEKDVGEIQKGEFVILNTGFHRCWGTEKYFKSCFLSYDAATYLTKKGIRLLGIDCFTVDDIRSTGRPIHVHFLKEHHIPIVESITNLSNLPNVRFRSICFPLKIKEGSGSPVRLVGVF